MLKSFPSRPFGSRIIIPILYILSICSVSCKKFLSSYSQNQSFIEKATDLNEVLIGEGFLDVSSTFLHVMDDDTKIARLNGSALMSLGTTGFHYWQPNPNITEDGKERIIDDFYQRLYKKIANINVVLHSAPLLLSKGEPADTLRRITGEAHFLRALYYFSLVNVYGQPYSPVTATSNFGVPLKIDPAVEGRFFARSTVEKVYDQILADLRKADLELEGFNSGSTNRPNQAAVQALFSRVYLYMEDYENALVYSNKIIGHSTYQLMSLDKYITGTDVLTRNSPEVLFTMGYSQMPSLMKIDWNAYFSETYLISDDLTSSYSPKDLRLNAFFLTTTSGDLKIGKKRFRTTHSIEDVSDFWLLRLSELYLNKAEALAMIGRDSEAIEALQELRKFRFKPEDLTAITVGGEALVNYIRDERRRELCFEGHRWFDLRRYGVNSKYPFSKTIRHISYAFSGTGYSQNGYYELKPYEQDQAAYIVPIARPDIEFNNGQLTNETRRVRPLNQ